jgi:hypothetical protein
MQPERNGDSGDEQSRVARIRDEYALGVAVLTGKLEHLLSLLRPER